MQEDKTWGLPACLLETHEKLLCYVVTHSFENAFLMCHVQEK